VTDEDRESALIREKNWPDKTQAGGFTSKASRALWPRRMLWVKLMEAESQSLNAVIEMRVDD